jgi:hypothetical protein
MDLFEDDGCCGLSPQERMALGQLTEADFLDEEPPGVAGPPGLSGGLLSVWVRRWLSAAKET